MSDTTSIYNQLYTSRDAALIDAKGNDYIESASGEVWWQDRPGEFGDGPYQIVRTNAGKWVIR